MSKLPGWLVSSILASVRVFLAWYLPQHFSWELVWGGSLMLRRDVISWCSNILEHWFVLVKKANNCLNCMHAVCWSQQYTYGNWIALSKLLWMIASAKSLKCKRKSTSYLKVYFATASRGPYFSLFFKLIKTVTSKAGRCTLCNPVCCCCAVRKVHFSLRTALWTSPEIFAVTDVLMPVLCKYKRTHSKVENTVMSSVLTSCCLVNKWSFTCH